MLLAMETFCAEAPVVGDIDLESPVAQHAGKIKLSKKRATGLPRLGKPKLPDAKRRVFVSVRVLPKTKAALEAIEAKNLGWAIDKLVAMAQEHGLFKVPTTFI